MANLFLDTNILFDITERDKTKREQLDGHKVFVSALSYHVLFYTYKYKIPNKKIIKHKREFYIIDLSDKILNQALQGPTKDLEDNIQLHSAAEAECDYILTNDKKLLKMKYFGKTKIVYALES
jgi:predicted nucleic acid-binding protein